MLPAAALAFLLASARPPLDPVKLARILGLDAPAAAPAVQEEAADWPAQVLGTMVASPERFSLAAVLYLPGRSVVTLSVGQRLAGAEVVAISRGSITLRTPEGLRRVGVNPNVPPPPPRPTGLPRGLISVEREIRRDELDLSRLSTGARGVPAFVDGQLAGIRFFQIQPGSLYDQAGLHAGDILQRINGHRLESPDAALEAYTELRTTDWVEAEIRRGDSVLVLRYRIR
ncbi:MAG TPA: hypothetical protein VIG99_15470 [Myxococcaceae bacterium]|jgi:general secretion pathway protein C